MITTYIIYIGLAVVIGWVHLLPSLQINITDASSSAYIPIYTSIRQYLNYFLGVPMANLIVFLLFGTLVALLVFALIKVIRYFLPLI